MDTPAQRAAEYVRMSTEHQQYSIANQSAAIREYANAHSIEIVRTYVDSGKSGLALDGRKDLQTLLRTVISGNADFEVLIVYDVSRWGRFQDVDESAYYEYSLKKAGVPVIYCAEPFRETGSAMDALIKTLKRVMAAEFSRELTVKVSAGQRRIAQSGYRLGGVAGFGFRRVAVDTTGSRRMVLADGERKSIQTDRVTLVHGPRDEVRAVRKVFALFVSHGFGETKIAAYLNERGILTRSGNRWCQETIHRMLTNPKYAGDMVFNQTLTKMGSSPVKNPREKWIYVPNRFQPIISREVWNEAQNIVEKRGEPALDGDVLALLRALLAKHGRLSSKLIDAEPGMLSAQTYQRRFGSLIEAYRRIGWGAHRRYKEIARRAEVRACYHALELAMTSRIAEIADHFSKHPRKPAWTVNDEISMYAAVAVARKYEGTGLVWKFHGPREARVDMLVIARLKFGTTEILDYYVFPGCYARPIKIFEQNPWSLDIHRFEDLRFLDLACRRTKLPDIGDPDV